MIAYKGRENKRGKAIKMPRNIERLYKEGKCRDCSVVVTRMDFAKILGKFTKVKIQYESSSSPKTQKATETAVPNSNARLKNNENGMVLLRRTAYNQHPVKDLVNSNSKKQKTNEMSTITPRQVNNVLKENNGSNKTDIVREKILTQKQTNNNCNKQYAIIFNDPSCNNNYDVKCDFSLMELLPKVDKSIFPSKEWCIDYFPKNEEPTDDKVYDRIAAELEDLMYSEKPDDKFSKSESAENKVDDFPSIMDILNDNNTPVNSTETKDQSSNIEFKDNLESSDVEAMLLGSQPALDNKETEENKALEEPLPMEVDTTDVNKLIEDVAQFSTSTESEKAEVTPINEIENPHSPSILDEALQKGIEEHLPCDTSQKSEPDVEPEPEAEALPEESSNIADENKTTIDESQTNTDIEQAIINDQSTNDSPLKESSENDLNILPTSKLEDITHVVFKKVVDGICQKSVTCPKNLKYSIELEEKSVEFLGAPKYISSLEDLQVLLQIVNETDLRSLYVLY
ncbi:uncharacterized protein LOC113399055 [Vanessa tameamea]|uniref:Uncharacterized protein LOC113399055 n=1 Tax=Vanessa tameamea TaxID=334116 RepID=A0A8B8IC94_VANTA|nr:uncharacterized protein LOC113399055 [Vanessa tameamea]